MPPLLQVKNLSFSYDSSVVLGPLSFELKKGESLGVIGPNGGGKSTLLNILAGLLTGFKGIVSFGGRVHPRTGEVAYLPQRKAQQLLFPLTCREFISLGKIHSGQGILSTDEALEFVGLTPKGGEAMDRLSGGEQQKAYLARTLVQGPLLFLLDEPTSGLDSEGQDHLAGLVKKITKEFRRTAVIVDHNIGRVLRHCDNILCLNKGLHWHDRKDILTKDILKDIYRCEFEHELLHERGGLGETALCPGRRGEE